jgi:hypothetical protein
VEKYNLVQRGRAAKEMLFELSSPFILGLIAQLAVEAKVGPLFG